MTNGEAEEWAKSADLLAPATGKKEVFLKTLQKKIEIQKITIGDLASILKASKEDEIMQFVLLVAKGMTKPALNIEECKKLPLKVTMEIAAEIAKFSELDKDSIEKVRNLLETGS